MKIRIVISCCLLFPSISFTQCPGTAVGPQNASSFTTVVATGSERAWTNPANAQTSNNAYATSSISNPLCPCATDYLVVKTFGFAIPAANTICGITVEIERSAGGAGTALQDYKVQLTKNGTAVVGLNKATATIWPAADAYAAYGSNADLWGTTWTPAEINA